MDLNTLTLKELKKLRKDVDKTIADFEDRKKREALANWKRRPLKWAFLCPISPMLAKSKKISPAKIPQPERSGSNLDRPWAHTPLGKSA